MEIRSVQQFLQYWDNLRQRTRSVATCIPPDRLEWTHRDGAFTLGDQVRHLARTEPQPRWIVVAAEPITDIDTTAADMLEDLDLELNARGISLVFADMKTPVRDKVQRYELTRTIDPSHFFHTIEEAVAVALLTVSLALRPSWPVSWIGELGGRRLGMTEGVPTVYEVNGREFVAIAVGGVGLFPPRGVGLTTPAGPSQYMVFALPKR